MSSLRRWASALIVPITIASALAAVERGGRADEDPTERHERCALRVSASFLGTSPTAALSASPDPQSSIDAMLADPIFVERAARFLNATFNKTPGDTPGQDPVYQLAKYVLTNDLPFKDLFVGRYAITANGAVVADAQGLGYFRNPAWMVRYAGNEQEGIRISAAYRILQNTTGLAIVPVTLAQQDDPEIAKIGRKAPACAGCHYDPWFALDHTARVLSRRKGNDPATMTFTPSPDGPQTFLDQRTIASDEELVNALVSSNDFKVWTCRLAFRFLYGRDETTCEAPLFDRCVDAASSTGSWKAGVAVIAKDSTFCQ